MRLDWKLALVLCALPALMGASVYRWVDDNGVVNYTQLKPEGVEAELVSADTGRRISNAPTTAPVEESAAQEPELNADQQEMLDNLRAAEDERQQQIARIREANCQQAREQLDKLTSRGRIRVVGDDGVERVMPDEERRERIDEAQRAVAANCAATASR